MSEVDIVHQWIDEKTQLMNEVGRLRVLVTSLEKENASLREANNIDLGEKAPLLVEITNLRARIAELEQVSGDICLKCGWAGIRGDDPCAFCRVAELEYEVDDLLRENDRLQRELG